MACRGSGKTRGSINFLIKSGSQSAEEEELMKAVQAQQYGIRSLAHTHTHTYNSTLSEKKSPMTYETSDRSTSYVSVARVYINACVLILLFL